MFPLYSFENVLQKKSVHLFVCCLPVRLSVHLRVYTRLSVNFDVESRHCLALKMKNDFCLAVSHGFLNPARHFILGWAMLVAICPSRDGEEIEITEYIRLKIEKKIVLNWKYKQIRDMQKRINGETAIEKNLNKNWIIFSISFPNMNLNFVFRKLLILVFYRLCRFFFNSIFF